MREGPSGFRFNGMRRRRSKTKLTVGQGLLTSPVLPRKLPTQEELSFLYSMAPQIGMLIQRAAGKA